MTSVSTATQIGDIKAALRQASTATGTDFDYLLKTAQRESSLRPDIKAKTSSATGLFQFIDQTWLATLKNSGQQLGYGKYADAIQRGPGGRHFVSNPALRQEILALRKDPLASSMMAGAYTRNAAEHLTNSLGRPPLEGELYVAHFLGPGGAERLIKAAQSSPNASAAKMFPRAAHANKYVFYERTGQQRSIGEVYKLLMSSYGPHTAKFADAQATAVPTEQKPAAAPNTLKPAAVPEGTQVQPAAVPVRLAGHFENSTINSGWTGQGRPFQTLFTSLDRSQPTDPNAADAPDATPQATPAASTETAQLNRPRSGPLSIIPASVLADASTQNTPRKPTGVPPRSDDGPLHIVPHRSNGLLKSLALHHNLFRTDTVGT